MQKFLWLIALLGLTACCAAPEVPPPNLGELKSSLIAYHDQGAYAAEFTAAVAPAADYLRAHAGEVAKPALVLDIDETSLSNWPALRADDFANWRTGPCDALPKGPCGLVAWQGKGADAALPATLNLYNQARALGVTVFFITGRGEALRAATAANLHRAGYTQWRELVLRPAGSSTPSAADYKAPQRARIEAQGYTILVNVGDQPSDLAGGHAQLPVLVPNPFYRMP